ncbi:MAG: hypothetical protein J6Z31_03985 [Fibrobacter sp.]|nr:hypothetical protein [Fibrobacter sp.]
MASNASAQAFLNVLDFGGIPNDGMPDDAALRSAFEEAKKQNAQGVFLPAGRWQFDSSIEIPRGFTLKGTYSRPHVAERSDLEGAGTTIECYVGRNADIEIEPWKYPSCVNIHGTASLEGVNLVYPEQTDVWNPVPYSWTIFCNSDYDENQRFKESSRCGVVNTTLVNSYAGIFMRWGANDHWISGVNMSVFKKGMVLDGITSLGVIQNVNIHNQYCWPFYGILASDHEKTNRLAKENLKNLVGIEFHRADWGWLNQVFIIFANKGFVFEKSMNAADSSQWELGTRALPSLDISNSGCDLCLTAVEANFVNTGVGVNFSNSNLLGRVILGDSCYGSLRFSNAFFSYGISAPDSLNDQFVVGKRATLQIVNSEVLNFPVDVPMWYGRVFTVRGILQLSNSILVSTDTSRYDEKTFKHLQVENSGIATVQNLVFRGPEFRYTAKEKGRIKASLIEHQEISEDFPYNPPR